MKISRINKYNSGKLRAFVDMDFDGLIVKGFKLMESINGLFVSMPSQKKRDGEGYENTCYMSDREQKDELDRMVIAQYQADTEEKHHQFGNDQLADGEVIPADEDLPF